MGIMNWLMDHVFDREGAREWREICAENDRLGRVTEALSKQVELECDIEGVRDRHPALAAMYPDMFERKHFNKDGTPILRRATLCQRFGCRTGSRGVFAGCRAPRWPSSCGPRDASNT